LGAVGLLQGQSTEGNQHGGVYCVGIVEEDTNDLLDRFVVSSIECSGVVWFGGVLEFGTIGGVLPGVWGMFRS